MHWRETSHKNMILITNYEKKQNRIKINILVYRLFNLIHFIRNQLTKK